MGKQKQLSRKDFLKAAGASAAGIALAGTFLSGCNLAGTDNGSREIAAPEWPYNYAKLDPEAAAERAYDGYQRRIDKDLGG